MDGTQARVVSLRMGMERRRRMGSWLGTVEYDVASSKWYLVSGDVRFRFLDIKSPLWEMDRRMKTH